MEILARRARFPTGSLLFYNGISPELRNSLESNGVALHSADDLLRDPTNCNGPAVLVLDRTRLNDTHKLEALPGHVVIVAADRDTEESLGEAIDLSLPAVTDIAGQTRVLRSAMELSRAHHDAARMQLDLTRSREDLFELNRIGMALMTEHDHEALLRQILRQMMDSTCADAGDVFLLETSDHGPPTLRFKLAVSDSVRDLKWLDNVVVPLDSTSLMGHVAVTRLPLVIADVNNLTPDVGFAFRTDIQEQYGIWIKSMLSIPLIDHLGALVGVLQLANRKRKRGIKLRSKEDVERHVVPFSERDVQLSLSLAGQAAVSIENTQLYEQIEHLFESFVRAAVTAIDQRDPTTAGHSIRVATLATDLAVALERSTADGKRCLTPTQMRELRYAALLHDFGKIGVREDVLVKAKKLPPALWIRVEGRFDLIRCNAELQYQKERARLREAGQDHTAVDAEFSRQIAQIDKYWQAICAANEPTILPREANQVLIELASHKFERDNKTAPYLTADELHFLQIPRGSLDESEMHEIQSHAEQTFAFLSQIPWTDDLKELATFASGHHEKLNGTGYPRHLRAEDIPIQTRLITIADIFDALTAADRPYKPAIDAERALDIMKAEANEGLLDAELVQIMIESQVYRHILDEDWRRL